VGFRPQQLKTTKKNGVAEQWDELGQAGGEVWKLLNHPAFSATPEKQLRASVSLKIAN